MTNENVSINRRGLPTPRTNACNTPAVSCKQPHPTRALSTRHACVRGPKKEETHIQKQPISGMPHPTVGARAPELQGSACAPPVSGPSEVLHMRGTYLPGADGAALLRPSPGSGDIQPGSDGICGCGSQLEALGWSHCTYTTPQVARGRHATGKCMSPTCTRLTQKALLTPTLRHHIRHRIELSSTLICPWGRFRTARAQRQLLR